MMLLRQCRYAEACNAAMLRLRRCNDSWRAHLESCMFIQHPKPDNTMLLFTTPRLRIRRLGPADVDSMFAIYGDAQAMRWVGDGEPLSRERCAEWIAVTLANYAKRGYGMCGITLHGPDALIG